MVFIIGLTGDDDKNPELRCFLLCVGRAEQRERKGRLVVGLPNNYIRPIQEETTYIHSVGVSIKVDRELNLYFHVKTAGSKSLHWSKQL